MPPAVEGSKLAAGALLLAAAGQDASLLVVGS